jgi:hypothetical protein
VSTYESTGNKLYEDLGWCYTSAQNASVVTHFVKSGNCINNSLR